MFALFPGILIESLEYFVSCVSVYASRGHWCLHVYSLYIVNDNVSYLIADFFYMLDVSWNLGDEMLIDYCHQFIYSLLYIRIHG